MGHTSLAWRLGPFDTSLLISDRVINVLGEMHRHWGCVSAKILSNLKEGNRMILSVCILRRLVVDFSTVVFVVGLAHQSWME